MADGYELSQDGQDQVAITLNNTSSYASLFGVTEKYYLESNYGRYMTMSELERILTEYQTAQEYAQHKGTSFGVSDDEIQAFYNENSAELDTIDYNCYLVGYDRTETDADGNTVDLDEATIGQTGRNHTLEILDALVAGDQSWRPSWPRNTAPPTTPTPAASATAATPTGWRTTAIRRAPTDWWRTSAPQMTVQCWAILPSISMTAIWMSTPAWMSGISAPPPLPTTRATMIWSP